MARYFFRIRIKNKRYIFIELFQKDNKKYLIIKDNSGENILNNNQDIFNKDFDLKSSNNSSKTGLYMTKIIIEKHTKGLITFDNIKFTYQDIIYSGNQFTIALA